MYYNFWTKIAVRIFRW